MAAVYTGNINFRWDPKSVEIRTLAVERLLKPLVTQVTTLVNTNSKAPSNKNRGRSEKPHVLAASVEQATENFLEKGDKIAKESQFLKEELVAGVEDVQKQGDLMKSAAGKFADDPCLAVKRGHMVPAAQLELYTMCMTMMEMTDFSQGKGPLKNTSDAISTAKKIVEAGSRMNKLGRTIADLNPDLACKQDLLAYLQCIALYCHQLNTCSNIKAEVENLGRELLISSVDSTMSRIEAAKNLMNAIVQTVKASYVASTKYPKSQGMASLNLPSLSWKMKVPEKKLLVKREEQDETQTKIKWASQKKHVNPVQVHKCNAVHQALQDLLSEYMGNAGRKERSDALNSAIDKMSKKTRNLCRQLCKAVMDHISDSFLETNVPLLVSIEAAKNGNEKEVKEYAQIFRANKLIEVANLACSISNNEEGVKLVQMSTSQLEALCPQVINSALASAAKPQSKLAQENMDLLKEHWGKQVHVLTDAVDDITSIYDFLAVSENHILESVNKCVIALQEKDVDGLDCTAGAIRGQTAWVIHVATSEMDNYELEVYTGKVLEATKLFSNTVIPHFTKQVEAALEALSSHPAQPMVENEFIDASCLVCNGIWDIRKAVLMIRTHEELDDSDLETEDFGVRSRTSVQTEDNQLIAGQSAPAILAQFPQDQKAKTVEQVPASKKKSASWMLKCPNGISVATTSSCWPSRCA
ncbi:Catenin alpha-2 [Heterocephalus glaber]|uniref:Catenin alpha-2 n=1 Tax=Heterocephalus glaber TaxID=10181 RepID=G5BDP0_HETGA|nr:Catenin alpha-2 [Heterocephalus glaber]